MVFSVSSFCFIQLIVVLIVCIPLNEAQESEYIVGGVNVAPGEIPYQISLQYNQKHNCGGSILNNCWILTAAHCVDGFPISALTVLAGTTKLNGGGGVRVSVERGVVHENFKRPKTPNDIAVVKLKECLTYNDYIQPVQLGTENIGSGVIGIVSGWGFTDQNGKNPTNDLKKLAVRTITNRQCSNTFRNVVAGNLCTLNVAGQGGCQGDSGGPLVKQNTKVQIGLVSVNVPCAKGYPDMYTRISTYLPWIQNHIQ